MPLPGRSPRRPRPPSPVALSPPTWPPPPGGAAGQGALGVGGFGGEQQVREAFTELDAAGVQFDRLGSERSVSFRVLGRQLARGVGVVAQLEPLAVGAPDRAELGVALVPLPSFHRSSIGGEPACASTISRTSCRTSAGAGAPAASSIDTATFPVARSSVNGVTDSTMNVGLSTSWSRLE